jgi:tRNA A37 threonylcarbamoyladenosine biosynthesis protein TsaE
MKKYPVESTQKGVENGELSACLIIEWQRRLAKRYVPCSRVGIFIKSETADNRRSFFDARND